MEDLKTSFTVPHEIIFVDSEATFAKHKCFNPSSETVNFKYNVCTARCKTKQKSCLCKSDPKLHTLHSKFPYIIS